MVYIPNNAMPRIFHAFHSKCKMLKGQDSESVNMQAGCSVSSLNYEGESCLHVAAGVYRRGEASLDLVRDLLQAGADINQRNSAGETAICYAVRAGTVGVIRSDNNK